MFKDVPLINISTKDINVKIPSLTSDDISKYGSYLQSRIQKNETILQDRQALWDQLTNLCSTTQAKTQLQNDSQLQQELATLQKASTQDTQKIADLQ